MSYSRGSTFLACRKLYEYKYAEGLVPRVDIPQIKRGDLVDQALCAAIVADQAGHGPDECESAANRTATKLGNDWLGSEDVVEYAKMSGDEWVADMAQLVVDSVLIACRAVRFLELGSGRWRTLAIPDPDDPTGRRLQFGCQPKILGDLNKTIAQTVGDAPNFKGHGDWVARDTETGHVWLIDFKVRKAIQAPETLEFDYQLPAYVAALRQMGVEVHGAAHLQIRALVPNVPNLLKPTAKSSVQKMSRANISTDWHTYREAVIADGLDPNDYLDMKEKLNPFDVFTPIYRSDEELTGIWAELATTRESIMQWHANPIATAPRRLHIMQCRGCQFDQLCLAELRGHDAEHIRETHFTIRDRS